MLFKLPMSGDVMLMQQILVGKRLNAIFTPKRRHTRVFLQLVSGPFTGRLEIIFPTNLASDHTVMLFVLDMLVVLKRVKWNRPWNLWI